MQDPDSYRDALAFTTKCRRHDIRLFCQFGLHFYCVFVVDLLCICCVFVVYLLCIRCVFVVYFSVTLVSIIAWLMRG